MMRRNKTFFAETCLYEAVGSLPVMPSLLPHVLWRRSQVSLFLEVWWALERFLFYTKWAKYFNYIMARTHYIPWNDDASA